MKESFKAFCYIFGCLLFGILVAPPFGKFVLWYFNLWK